MDTLADCIDAFVGLDDSALVAASDALFEYYLGSLVCGLGQRVRVEPEHGLQLVFRDGRVITRISEYDGHPTHRDAWGPRYVPPPDAIYWSPPQ